MVDEYKIESNEKKLKKHGVIIAIDSENFLEYPIRTLNNVYSSTNLYVVVMGPKNEIVEGLIPKNLINELIFIPSVGFNYSYCINRMIRHLIETNHNMEEIIAITDMNIVFSLLQIESQISELNFNECFIKIDILNNNYDKPLNTDSGKIILNATKRIKLLEKNDNISLNVPAFVTNLKTIDKFNGLEEILFTDISREFFIDTLKKFKYEEVVSSKCGLVIKKNSSTYNNHREIDKKIVDELTRRFDSLGYSKNNIDVEFGSPSSMKKITLSEDGFPIWRSSVLEENTIKIESTKNDKSETELEKIDIYENEELVNDLNYNIKSPVLICVNNDMSQLISTTPLIRKLKKLGHTIDLMSNFSSPNFTSLIDDGVFINKVWNKSSFYYGDFNIYKYKTIIKTSGYTSKLKEGVDINTINVSDKDNMTEANISILGKYDNVDLHPFCFYKNKKKIIIPFKNIVTFVCSVIPKKPDEFYESLDETFKNLLNYFDKESFTIGILCMPDERTITNLAYFKKRKNTVILTNGQIEDYSALIEQSSIIITSEYSKMFWLSYGLRKKTIIVKKYDAISPEPKIIPDCSWSFYCKHNDTEIEEKVKNLIWDII